LKNKNIKGFYWHAFFLALTKNFMDINTVVPAILIGAGGNSIHMGLLSAITIGGSRLAQLFFGNWLNAKKSKKKFLLLGIYLRVFSLFAIAVMLLFSSGISNPTVILLIFLLISIFSFSGAFANISYVDILGKTLRVDFRKKFFVNKQIFSSIGILFSAFAVRHLIKQYNYPLNYSILFFIGAFLLFTATGGFWIIKEKPKDNPITKKSVWNLIKSIPNLLKKDSNLKNFIIISNILGLGLSMIPFYITLAKKSFGLTGGDVGNYLFLQIFGMVASNFLWLRLSKNKGYKAILNSLILINFILPFVAIYFKNNAMLYLIVFFISGFSISAFQIISGGILVDISNEKNRSVYTGISGAGSILPAIAPILIGLCIQKIGFNFVFFFIGLFFLFTFYFSKKLILND